MQREIRNEETLLSPAGSNSKINKTGNGRLEAASTTFGQAVVYGLAKAGPSLSVLYAPPTSLDAHSTIGSPSSI